MARGVVSLGLGGARFLSGASLDAARPDQWATDHAEPDRLARAGIACLRDTGLAEGEKFSVFLLVAGFVRNRATLEADVGEAAAGSGTSAEEAMSGYGRLLARLTDPQRFPALHAVIEAGVLDRQDEPNDPNAEFVFGLERVLNGIDTWCRNKPRPTLPASYAAAGRPPDRCRGGATAEVSYRSLSRSSAAAAHQERRRAAA